MEPNLPDQLLEAQDLTIATLGRITQFWGFTPTLGRVYGLLYLSTEPLDREQIQARLSISAGNASMAVKELLRWGVAHKSWVKGSRRAHFRAETDFWRMVSTVLNERERKEIQTATEDVERALSLARAARKACPAAAREAVAFNVARMERLLSLYQLAQRLLDLLLSTLSVDIKAVLKLFRAT